MNIILYVPSLLLFVEISDRYNNLIAFTGHISADLLATSTISKGTSNAIISKSLELSSSQIALPSSDETAHKPVSIETQ